MRSMHKVVVVALAVLILAGCKDDNDPIETTLDTELRELLEDASPNGRVDFFQLPGSKDFNDIPQDPRNPLTTDKVALGKQLYHETALAI